MMNYEYPGDVDRIPALGEERGGEVGGILFFFCAILGSQISRQIQEECAVVRAIDFYLSL